MSTPAQWDARLIRVVRELSGHGVSDRTIALILGLYEAFDVSGTQVMLMRKRHGIDKPISEIRTRLYATSTLRQRNQCG